jgi:uncharacterized protein with FMN-binding domain
MHRSITMITATTVALGATGLPVAEAVTATSAAQRRVVGSYVHNRFGTSSVVIYVQGKKIVQLKYSLPTDRARSASINGHAGPILRSEALSAQSSHIHAVSGATYTSKAFTQSLQVAITRAHIG